MAMTKSTKAALYSALVLPGAGLWWLKHYWRACVFLIPASLSLIYITKCLLLIINTIMLRMADGALMVDMFNLTQTTTLIGNLADQITENNHMHLGLAENLLMISWACSIVSSYFAGKKLEQTEQKNIDIK